MGNILKLTNAGESHTMTIATAEQVEGNYGPQVKFEGEDGTTIYLPKDSADRQLVRIPLTYDECAGIALTFSRDPNPKPGSKPYWGIRIADAVDRSQPTEARRMSSPYGGKPIKGLDDGDIGYGVDPHEHFPTHQAGTPVPPPSDSDAPDWVAGIPKAVAPNAEKKRVIMAAYLDLFRAVRAELKGVDDVAVQAATATIWISWKDRGVQP